MYREILANLCVSTLFQSACISFTLFSGAVWGLYLERTLDHQILQLLFGVFTILTLIIWLYFIVVRKILKYDQERFTTLGIWLYNWHAAWVLSAKNISVIITVKAKLLFATTLLFVIGMKIILLL